MSLFANKHIVITGGAKGVGEACVEVMRREDGKVSIFDIDDGAQKEYGPDVAFYKVDISKEKQVQNAVGMAITKFGDINILINNAGIVKYASVTEATEEEWDLIMNVNLKGSFLCAKHAIPSMLKKGNGVIVNVASVQAFISQQKVAAYTTSKTALLGLTRSIAVDYSPHIRCVAVCPGTIDTPMLHEALKASSNPDEVYKECIDMHLVKKLATAHEVAEFISYLASDKASFITGQSYRIDGGLGIFLAGSKRE